MVRSWSTGLRRTGQGNWTSCWTKAASRGLDTAFQGLWKAPHWKVLKKLSFFREMHIIRQRDKLKQGRFPLDIQEEGKQSKPHYTNETLKKRSQKTSELKVLKDLISVNPKWPGLNSVLTLLWAQGWTKDFPRLFQSEWLLLSLQFHFLSEVLKLLALFGFKKIHTYLYMI